MELHFYVLLVITTRNETNEYDIGRGGMEKVRNVQKILVSTPKGKVCVEELEDIILKQT